MYKYCYSNICVIHAKGLLKVSLFTAIFGMSRNAPPQKKAAHNQTIFLSWNKPITASIPFSRTFSRQILPLKLALLENVFYLWIPSSETSQMNMRISLLCLRMPKNTSDAWMSFVCIWRLFKVQGNYQKLSNWKIIVRKEDIYFNLPNKGTEKSSSFAWFVDSEFWMPLFSPVFNL